MKEIVLSGIVGALLATVLNAGFQLWLEQIRVKADTMIRVVSWADITYALITNLHGQKDGAYTAGKLLLTDDEYRLNSRDIRDRLMQDELGARVALIYGEGEELRRLRELRDEMLNVARALWAANDHKTWPSVSKSVHDSFEKRIDPLRSTLERSLLVQSNLRLIWRSIGLRLTSDPPWRGVSNS